LRVSSASRIFVAFPSFGCACFSYVLFFVTFVEWFPKGSAVILLRTLGIVILAMLAYCGTVLLLDRLAGLFPPSWRERLRVIVFVGPAILLLVIGLVLPAFRTIILSLMNNESKEIRASTNFIGFRNYTEVLGGDAGRNTIRNNIWWVLIVPTFSVGIGVAIATLADKYRGEAFAKALIFLPNAISLAGAGIVWKFIYQYKPSNEPQYGVLNKILVSLGFGPHRFLQNTVPDWSWLPGLNTFFLMVVMIWVQAGFATVVLSAAIKGVPADFLEASRIDGANERQVFWKVLLPSIRPSVIVVWTTITIAVLKAFDVVKSMTGGNFQTDVVASSMMRESFSSDRVGYGSALAVVLFIAVVPIMWFNIRSYRAEQASN
jgi:alpha-glucoside transport system permease protein